MIRKIAAFETTDGKLFKSQDEALNYDIAYNEIEAYFISYDPDIFEEDTFCERGYILVHGKKDSSMLAKYFAYEKFGNPITLDDNSVASQNYVIGKCLLSTVEEDKILAKIEGPFVKRKIFDESDPLYFNLKAAT